MPPSRRRMLSQLKQPNGGPTSQEARPQTCPRPQPGEMPTFDINDDAGVEAARQFYDENGAVIVRLLDRAACIELVKEQWREIITQQPWSDSYRLTMPREPADDDDSKASADMARFVDMVMSPLTPSTRKKFEAGWTLHRGFGACCDPSVFHLRGVWNLRQHPRVYALACALTGESKLWVDINRSIHKLPGQGEAEFLHWDLNPFALSQAPASSTANRECPHYARCSSVSGKVCYTESRFVCVLRTHTPEFAAKFADLYREIYPNVLLSATKFALDFSKEDPLGLIDLQREYRVPGGCLVMWSTMLLHGQIKTPLSEPTEYGCYISFQRAVSRPEYALACRKAGVDVADELQDRLKSYYNGISPTLWPSMDTICFYPKRFQNYPDRDVGNYIKRMPPMHPSISSRITKSRMQRTKEGARVHVPSREVPHLKPWCKPGYEPPELTQLGRRLLGLDPWPSS